MRGVGSHDAGRSTSRGILGALIARRRAIWRLTAGGGLLGASWAAVRSPRAQRLDVAAGDGLRRCGGSGTDAAVTATTDLGSLYGVAGMAAALAVCGHRDAALDVLGTGGAAWSLAQTNKTFVRRARPYEAHGVRRLVRPPAGSSFPSGHAAVGVATTAVLADRARGTWPAAGLAAVGAYVAASRVYVGVHYPTDVVGGASLGLLVAGAWRGPVAIAGRRSTGAVARRVRRHGPAVARATALAVLAVRLYRARSSTPARPAHELGLYPPGPPAPDATEHA